MPELWYQKNFVTCFKSLGSQVELRLVSSLNPRKDLVRVGELDLSKKLKQEFAPCKITPIQARLLAPLDGSEEVVYQHSVLCQTCIPYRDPGDGTRMWKRTNGRIKIELQAGRLFNPRINDFVDVGLPFGPKPRLVLFHLNTEAIRTRSPFIEMEDSLTAFAVRILGKQGGIGGRNIRTIKDQLNRLASVELRFGMSLGNGRGITIQDRVIRRLELWTAPDPNQRVLWPTTVEFSHEYFNNLLEHAVPLNEGAVGALSHSALGLDVYTWLAQRLHRVSVGKPALVPWVSLKDQFGQDYDRIRDFRRIFSRTLQQVKAVYSAARFELDPRGMLLFNSAPPVLPRGTLR